MKTRRISVIFSALALTLCLAVAAQARVQLPSTGKAAAQISAPSLTPTPVQPSAKKARPAQWTVMVYLNGNSNLAPDTLRIVDEMERIGSSADMQLVAHITRRGDQLREPAPYVQTESGLIVPSHQIIEPDDITGGTYRYHVLKDKLDGSVSSMPLYAAGDPGSSATLLDFVKWAKAAYPARHYMLMIYGHGAGMMGTSASDEAGGGSSMTIPDLAFALRGAGGVDVLFFYSCLMQMAEVSARLDGAAKVILGSETSMLTGVPFESMFQAVHDNLSQDAQGVGAAIFSEVANHDTRLGGTDPVFALSVVKPSGIRKVIPALNAYVSAVMKAQDLDSALAARDNVLRMHDSGLYADYADLGNFVMIQAQLSRSEAVRAAAQKLLDTMFSDYVVQLGQENAGPSKATTGVSVYLPARGSRMLPPSAYNSNPIGASKWGAFIRWLNLDRGDGR